LIARGRELSWKVKDWTRKRSRNEITATTAQINKTKDRLLTITNEIMRRADGSDNWFAFIEGLGMTLPLTEEDVVRILTYVGDPSIDDLSYRGPWWIEKDGEE